MAKQTKQSDLLKMSEVSEMLNVHPNTLRQWDAKGILKAIRFGSRGDRRYRREDVEKLLEGRNQK
ncbi:MAG: MerR family transcriptional regulator [Candidatus Daviesbacteria bacterium]|nr:MerR family transcriptional regulator [Candidatus Daviesbacteria bacterium]